nr:polyketide synthase dehydratase domain-containing protein [Amycolatopsis rubida]
MREIAVVPGDPVRVTASAVVRPAGNPYLEAHFPGRTILPGVFVLEAVRHAVRAAAGTGPELLELTSARFTRPVREHDRIELEVLVSREESGRLKVSASCGLAAGPRTATVEAVFGRRA